MRYLCIAYYKKPSGQMDEVIAVSKNLKKRDLQTASVILDFKKLQVVTCNLDGVQVPKDWDHIVKYYFEHYENIITRLFDENGYTVEKREPLQ